MIAGRSGVTYASFKCANPGLFLLIFVVLKHKHFREKIDGISGIRTRGRRQAR